MEAVDIVSADEIGQYRSVSTAAVLALALGVLSLVAFTSLLMLIVPMAAVALACWALHKINRSDGALSGARLAYWGLALALLFGVASVVRVQVRTELLRRQADEAARRWLTFMVKGQFDQALSYLTPGLRMHLSTPQGNPVSPPAPSATFGSAQLQENPLVSELNSATDNGQFKLTLRESRIVLGPSECNALLIYEAKDGQNNPLSLTLLLSKSTRVPTGAPWYIDRWQSERGDAEVSANSPHFH